MKEKSKMELIKEFIETCPYLKNGQVNVDYIKDKPQSYSIDETPVDPVLQNFSDGGRRLQIQFDFSIQASFSALENIKNSKFCDDFTDWIYEQIKRKFTKDRWCCLDKVFRKRNNLTDNGFNSNICNTYTGSL